MMARHNRVDKLNLPRIGLTMFPFLLACVVACSVSALAGETKRPRLMSEVLYADKSDREPPSDALVWAKVLLDLGLPGSPLGENFHRNWRGCNYQSALATLSEIRSQLGTRSNYQKVWAANQDKVLSACERSSEAHEPPVRAIGKSLPRRAEADFLYQLGSWHFYRNDYKSALSLYRQAERMTGAPQRPNAAYMVVRSLAHLNRAEEAYHKIAQVLSDRSLRSVHRITRNYRFVIMSNSRSFNLDPSPELAVEHLKWLQEVVRISPEKAKAPMEAMADQKDAFEQLNSYFPLYAPDTKAVDWWLQSDVPESPRMRAVKILAPKTPLVDWMQAKWAYNVFDSDWLMALHGRNNLYWAQNRNIVLHALKEWNRKGDGEWLRIAVQRVHPRDSAASDILSAAEPFLDRPWKRETPEYRQWLFDLWENSVRIRVGRDEVGKAESLISSHRDFSELLNSSWTVVRYNDLYKTALEKALRWLVYTGQFERARSFLGIAQSQFRDEFRQWRSLLATNLDEAISPGIAPDPIFGSEFGNSPTCWQEMLNLLPSRVLYSIATDNRVKEADRALISRTLFARAVLLRHDDVLDKYAVLAAKLNPEIREQLLEAVAGHNRDKYIGFLLKMPRFRPGVYLEYAQDERRQDRGKPNLPIGAIDTYNHNDNNWWCGFDEEFFQQRIFNAMKIVPSYNELFSADGIDGESEPYLNNQRNLIARHPYTALIDPEEIEALEDIPSGPEYLSGAIIKREKDNPTAASSDERNERAANLHRAVRTTRYGCNRDGEHGEYSREAFIYLHSRYEDTPWAKATPYWFR